MAKRLTTCGFVIWNVKEANQSGTPFTDRIFSVKSVPRASAQMVRSPSTVLAKASVAVTIDHKDLRWGRVYATVFPSLHCTPKMLELILTIFTTWLDCEQRRYARD